MSVSSCTTHNRRVFSSERRIVSRSSGSERAQVDDFDLDPLACERCGGGERLVQHHPVGEDGDVTALARDRRVSDRHDVIARGNVAADRAVRSFVFEDEHRIGIADRGEQQPFRVGRRRGCDDLESGRVRVERFDRLRMVRAAAKTAAVRGAHDHRARPVTAGAPADLGGFADQMIHRGVHEIGELDLRDRPQTAHRQPDRDAGDHRLGHRHVDDPRGPEPVEQAFGRAENAAQLPDVFAQHEHALVALHLLAERLAHGFDHAQLTHTRAP